MNKEFKQGDRPAGIQAWIIIPWQSFISTPLWWFGKGLEEMRIAAKAITGYTYDNNHNKVEHRCCSEPLAFSIHREEYAIGSQRDREFRSAFPGKAVGEYIFTLSLWNLGGNRAIFNKSFAAAMGSTLPDDVVALAGEAAKKFGKGVILCSDCKEDVEQGKAGGNYFAGTYCVSCWEGSTGQHKGRGGWKFVESKETYD